jgi:hypothetical protein
MAVLYSEAYTPGWAYLTFFLPCFLQYHVECTAESLRLGYLWPMYRVVAVRDIVRCEVVPDLKPLRNWGGWGYRMNRAGVGYIAQGGPGVKIVIKGKSNNDDDNKTVFFSCKDPAALVKLLAK